MPPRKAKAGGSSSSKKDEIQVSKSPAEFFAENQSIAGFDNPVSLCGVFLFCV
jgi:DNA topoisomerase VI subunit B